MQRRLYAAFLLLALAATLAFAQTERSAPPRARAASAASVEAELKKLEREWFDAVVKGDRDKLEQLFATDFIATSSTGAFINKAEMIAEMSSGRIKLDDIRSDDFKLRLHSNTAIVTGRSTYVRGGRALGQASHTEVWVKRAGRWQAISWQSTNIGRGNSPTEKTATAASERQDEILAAGKGEKKMYGLIGKIVTVAGQREALIAILLEGTTKIPGCLSYVVAKDPADANTIWITEVWDSAQSHQASLSLPSVREAIARGKPLIASFGDYTVTEPVGGLGLIPAKTK